MGTILSRFMSEDDIRKLAVDYILPKIIQQQKEQSLPESSPSDDLDAACDTLACYPSKETDAVNANSPPKKKKSLKNLQEVNADANAAIKTTTHKRSSKSKSKAKNLPSTSMTRKPLILCQKQLPPQQKIKDSNNNPRSSSPTGNESGGSGSTKSLTKSKSKTQKLAKALSSREIIKTVLKNDGMDFTENMHPVEITATLKLLPDYTVTFKYSYNPATKTEVFKTNCGKDKLTKLEIPMDKNGNADASQFIKALTKLSSKHEGTIVVNGYTITTEPEPSKRLKMVSIDIRTSPMVVQLSPKGIKGVTAIRSQTRLEICGETEFGGDEANGKRIKFQGPNAQNIKLYSPEGKGKLFVCIPTLDQIANPIPTAVE